MKWLFSKNVRYFNLNTNKYNVYTLKSRWHSRGQRFDPAYLHQNTVFHFEIRCFSNFLALFCFSIGTEVRLPVDHNILYTARIKTSLSPEEKGLFH